MRRKLYCCRFLSTWSLKSSKDKHVKHDGISFRSKSFVRSQVGWPFCLPQPSVDSSVGIYMWRPEVNPGYHFSDAFHLVYLGGCLTDLELAVQMKLLARESQISACLYFPSLGALSRLHSWQCCVGSGVTCSRVKRVTDWAITSDLRGKSLERKKFHFFSHFEIKFLYLKKNNWLKQFATENSIDWLLSPLWLNGSRYLPLQDLRDISSNSVFQLCHGLVSSPPTLQ